jgi:chromosome segregation protein
MSTPEGVADHVRALLQRSPGVGANDWLALANLALAEVDTWIIALQRLEVTEQLALLQRLHGEDAGPFADVLALLMARHANEFEDLYVRDWVRDEAVEVSDRRVALIESQRTALEELVGHAEQRQSEEFDAAAEIERLEGRLHKLEREEVDQDLQRVQELEHEIARLEHARRRLESYDEPALLSHLEDLRATTGALELRREELGREVDRLISERDRARQGVESGETDLASLQTDTEQLRRQADELQRQNGELEGGLASLRGQIDDLNRQHAALGQSIATAQQEREDTQSQIEQDRVRLHDLRESPAAQQAAQLREKLNEIWPLLPPDEAEKEFRRPSARR